MANARESAVERAKRMIDFDTSFGADRLCGVDEAGRGPLAGPVAVCACVIPSRIPILGINDSKKVSEANRERLFDEIKEVADFCVVTVDEKTIDELNILQATKLGMVRAVAGLSAAPDLAVIDAVSNLDLAVDYRSVVKADAKSYAVAAASIMAKVTRDRIMRKYDAMYPMYGFIRNKGYGTAEHIEALKKYGPCPIHRRSFIGNFVDIGVYTAGEKSENE